MQGQIFGQRLVRDDYAGGVRPGIADGAFHAHGQVNQFADVWGAVVELFELRHFHGVFLQGDGAPGDKRHQLSNAVYFCQGNVHHAAHVAQGGLGAHGAKGDDLGYLVVAVLACAVLQHLGAAVVLEVQVNVGHFDAAGVEEALEDEVMLQRVYQRNVQGERHDGAGCRAARVVPDAALAGMAAQIPYNEEIGVKAHVMDDAQFVVEPLADLLAVGALPVAPLQSFLAQAAQVSLGRFACWNFELGQVIAFERQVNIAALGHQ